MYTMSQIRNRVNALKRKYATELKILKVFPIAEEFSLDWACMAADRLPCPKAATSSATWPPGVSGSTPTPTSTSTLNTAGSRGTFPDALGILSSLFPEVPRDKLADLLPYNEPPREHPGWFAAKSHEILRASCLVLAAMRRLTAPQPSQPGRHRPASRAEAPRPRRQPVLPPPPPAPGPETLPGPGRLHCSPAPANPPLPSLVEVQDGCEKAHSHGKRGRREKVPFQSSWYGLVGAGLKPALAGLRNPTRMRNHLNQNPANHGREEHRPAPCHVALGLPKGFAWHHLKMRSTSNPSVSSGRPLKSPFPLNGGSLGLGALPRSRPRSPTPPARYKTSKNERK